MNKKITSLLLIAVALGALSVSAQTTTPATATAPATAAAPVAPAAPSSSWVLTPAFVSQYMFRGSRLSGFSFEPTVEYDSGSLAVGVWANFPLANKVVGQSDPEIDPYGSYTFTINDSLNVAPGFTLYTYPNATKSNGFYKLTFEPNFALNYTVGGVKLTPKIYYDFVLKGPTYEFTAAYAVPLKDAGTELDFTGTFGTFIWKDAFEDTNPRAKNWGDYYLVGVAAPFQMSANAKLTIGWAYTKGSNNYVKIGTAGKFVNSGAVGRGVFSISYAMTF